MKKVKDIMTEDPTCCLPDTDLKTVAKSMADFNFGEMPVIDEDHKPIGVVTDRDIVCRTIAKDKNPFAMKAAECMTVPPITVDLDTSIDDCCRLMQKYQIRRIPVVDSEGKLCGIVSQADIALKAAGKAKTVVQEVSKTGSHAREAALHS